MIQQHSKWIGHDPKPVDQVMYSEGFYLFGVKTENLEKSEIRNPKIEIRNKSEILIFKMFKTRKTKVQGWMPMMD